jgi:hypothetical protein
MTWCVLVCDDGQMAHDVKVLGPYRNQENASKAADRINRKIAIHSEAMGWPSHDGEPSAWIQQMRYKVTEVYADLQIQKLEKN